MSTQGAPTVATVLYDGACGFCTRSIEIALDRLGAPVRYEPWQTADLGALGLSAGEAARTLHWVSPEGRIQHGAGAVGALLVSAGRPWSLLGRLVLAPPVSWVAGAAYALVTRIRRRLPGSIPALARLPEDRPGAR